MNISKEATGYWKAFGRKCLENLSSVKVWMFILPFIISTFYMAWIIGSETSLIKEALKTSVKNPEILDSILKHMKTAADTFTAWCTFNVSLAGTIIVVRETFKVSKLKALNEEQKENTDEIKAINI